ncbi:DNA repair and recombination protein, partial [Colletotrichum musicola]
INAKRQLCLREPEERRWVDGEVKAEWRNRWLLVLDEVSMLGGATLSAINSSIRRFRDSDDDFGGIPVVIFCGDFHQFRPVTERSIILPSDPKMTPESRHKHDEAHALWLRFSTVIILVEQVRAAADIRLQQLLHRIRAGQQNAEDVDLLNTECYRPQATIPWETGITVVTPLNRNRWNLNMEATLHFQRQHDARLHIFTAEHTWPDDNPTEEEAVLILSQGDESTTSVPAVFLFVPGMPVIVNQNIHQSLKLVNGAPYTAIDIIVDPRYPAHRLSTNPDTVVHFGPPAGIILKSNTTRDFNFVGLPTGTIEH